MVVGVRGVVVVGASGVIVGTMGTVEVLVVEVVVSRVCAEVVLAGTVTTMVFVKPEEE
jgi:hypothetical protein